MQEFRTPIMARATLQIAYKDANLPNITARIRPGPFAVRFRRTGSDRPQQILQFEEIGGLLLPALDADMPDGIAVTMQQHQRHQPPLQVGRDIGPRIAKTLEQAPYPPR